jgi:hypothetical protein
MGRWHAIGVTEGPSSIEAPPPFAARTVPLPIASRWGGPNDRKALHPCRKGLADRAIACFAADVPI